MLKTIPNSGDKVRYLGGNDPAALGLLVIGKVYEIEERKNGMDALLFSDFGTDDVAVIRFPQGLWGIGDNNRTSWELVE